MLRRVCIGLALTLLVACSDDLPGPDPDPEPTASAALVSAPVAPSRVFVAMPPATAPGGTSVAISVKRSDASVTTPIVDGGFDPVAIAAVAGDSLVITVTGPGGAEVGYARVPAATKPVVVRTSPCHGCVGVSYDPDIRIVFNEPMDPTTLSQAITVRARGVDVPGTVTAVVVGGDVLGARFVPHGSLELGTTCVVEVSTAARNLNGTTLDAPVLTVFTVIENGPWDY